MKTKRFIMLFACCLICLLAFSGCDDNAKQVPDSVLERYVSNSEWYKVNKESGDDFKFIWTAEHQTDKVAHTDLVKLTMSFERLYVTDIYSCSVLYQYDRTSDLWSVIEADRYWDGVYKVSKKLEGDWPISMGFGSGMLHVEKVDNDEIQLSCEISVEESPPLSSTTVKKAFDAKTTTTTTIQNNLETPNIRFTMPLPENYYSARIGEDGRFHEITIGIYVNDSSGISGFDISEYHVGYEE